MHRSPHLLLAVTGHGYGHLAQCAPVINALYGKLPDLRLTVMTELPRPVVAQRLLPGFDYLQAQIDPVLCMHNAWEVDVAASRQAYREFHRDWDAALQRETEQLRTLAPDLVLADIPYRLILAARQAGIPTVALCSLNWADIYAAYCGTGGENRTVLEQMMTGYRAAVDFLAPAPAMPMPGLDNCHGIGTIARQGVDRRAELLGRLSLRPGSQLVLISLGGIPSALPLANWPRMDGVIWLFPQSLNLQRDDLVSCASPGMPFIDMLASSDAVLTKPGYGTYAEAVCNGVPLLTLARPDWPETQYLNAWAQRHGCLREISRDQFHAGEFAAALHQLWDEPVPDRRPAPDGVEQAAEILAGKLR